MYCHLLIHAEIYIYILDTYRCNEQQMQETSLTKYLPLILLQGFERVVQGLRVRGSWRLNINCNILTPNLWPATLCLSRSPLDPNSIRAPESPFSRVWLSLPHLLSNWHSNSTVLPSVQFVGLIYLQTPTRWYRHASTPPQFLPISGNRDVSLPLSLEWPVWSSSSGNNCHAVQRSLSSGASVYESIMGFFLPRPISSANFCPHDFLS